MNEQKYLYCGNYFDLSRFMTNPVVVGNVAIGGQNDICIQSMTNTDTNDLKSTVQQCIELSEAGSQLIRLTAQGVREAKMLGRIMEKLEDLGINTPLVADIHFKPEAAEVAAKIVSKVRINPGNYSSNLKLDFSSDLQTINKNAISDITNHLRPLFRICRKNDTAIRVGVNLGSISERIVFQYGRTAEALAVSAIEFMEICREEQFGKIIISLKASNLRVLIHANRLLVYQMKKRGYDFPIHIGVTEAGGGYEGVIRSAAGIGALLADGIGDTMRVSLTGNPVEELPVANILRENFSNIHGHQSFNGKAPVDYNPYKYSKRQTTKVANIGDSIAPVVISNSQIDKDLEFTPDFTAVGNSSIIDFKSKKSFQILDYKEFERQNVKTTQPIFLRLETEEITKNVILRLRSAENVVIVLSSRNKFRVGAIRAAILNLMYYQCNLPVVIYVSYKNIEPNKAQVIAAADTGLLFIDGLADGLWVDIERANNEDNIRIAFSILQATRARISTTEYIACPSCGRTLFDISAALNTVKERTNHLIGLKIAVMGCVVNGPGEMADADYGYIGAGRQKVNLYKGQNLVIKGVEEDVAVDKLIEIIKNNNDWVKP